MVIPCLPAVCQAQPLLLCSDLWLGAWLWIPPTAAPCHPGSPSSWLSWLSWLIHISPSDCRTTGPASLTDNTRPKPVSSPPLLLRAQNNCGPKSCFTTDSHSNHCTEITLSLLTQFSFPSLPSSTLAPAEMATKCQQTARNRNSKFQKPRPPPLPPPLLRLDCRGRSNLWC